MRFLVALSIIFALLTGAGPGRAQDETAEEDKGRITRYLEDALSGLGREVRIDGFRGALSSRVSMDRLTVSDDQGVWLTLTDAVLDWNRAAILRGRINITQISARQIDVARVPVMEETASPEASSGFSLPELPVSIDIKSLAIDEVTLDASIIGQPIALSLNGAVTLEGGQGQATLGIERLEGPRGVFDLDASYANTTRQMTLDLTLDEAADGITATLLNLPGKPALELTVSGDAPIDEFVAEVALRSDGEDRLTGRVSTQLESAEGNPEAEEEAQPRIILVDIAGDLAPLFAPQYRPFFGPDVALQSLMRLFPDGRVSLENLKLAAASLQLDGALDVAADGLPERFNLSGVISDPSGDPVLLPSAGPETRVHRAEISARYDVTEGEAWRVKAQVDGLDRPDLTLEEAQITASGTINSAGEAEVDARLDGTVRGLELADAALSQALGTAFSLGGDLRWREGEPLDLRDIRLEGDGLSVAATGQIKGLETAGTFDGTVTARVDDLTRLQALAGQATEGRLSAELEGQAALLTGAFDLDLTARGTDLRIGVAQVDDALQGNSTLIMSGKRDETGLTLRTLDVSAAAGRAQASGLVTSDTKNLDFQADLDDLARFVEGIAGPVRLSGTAREDVAGWLINATADGPLQASATGQVTVPAEGGITADLSGEIGNVAGLIPELPGQATFTAKATQNGDSWTVDTSGTGPGGSTFAVAGQVQADASTAALDIDGTLPLALANRRISPTVVQGTATFDLRLDGPLAASSVSGRLATSGARVAIPDLKNALTDIDATIDLSGARAQITTSASLATGGRLQVNGNVGTAAPFATRLAVQILDATISDPKLFETTAQGNLIVSGNAPQNLGIAGRINLGRTEIRVPSSGLGGGTIPDIDHVNEPAAVRRTRREAGLIEVPGDTDGGSGGIAIGLDVLIAADNQIFVRGRGLDAELGGRFRVTGTTADIVPIGGFDLIRGRLDILGQRLSLDEGVARLQGDFVPGLRLVASTVSADDTTVRIIIQGRADSPDVSFTSDPALPEDEVLARLLFGRDIGSLSAFQALQLASAVATLAGRGGTSLAERIRKNTGLDDFSIGSDGEGGTTVGVGKYISDNVYTDVQIGDQNNTEINLNIDLSRRTKLRGQLGSDGGTSVGIFFEKDY